MVASASIGDMVSIERRIEIERTHGSRTAVRLVLGDPTQRTDGHWACDVAAHGLFDRLPPAVGVDAMQALLLAVFLLRRLVEAEIQRGAVIYWCDERCSVARLFELEPPSVDPN